MELEPLLGLAGGAVVLGAILAWQISIAREKVARRPMGMLLVFFAGTALAIAGAALSATGGAPSLPLIAGAVACALLTAYFAWLNFWLGKTPDGELRVAVGDPLPPLSALDHSGARVTSADWRGRRLLLKFFRGHW